MTKEVIKMSKKQKLYDPEIQSFDDFANKLQEMKKDLSANTIGNDKIGGAYLEAQCLVNYATDNLGSRGIEAATKMQYDLEGLFMDRFAEAVKTGKDLAKEFPGITGIQHSDVMEDKTKLALGFTHEGRKEFILSGGGIDIPVNTMTLVAEYDGIPQDLLDKGKGFGRGSGKEPTFRDGSFLGIKGPENEMRRDVWYSMEQTGGAEQIPGKSGKEMPSISSEQPINDKEVDAGIKETEMKGKNTVMSRSDDIGSLIKFGQEKAMSMGTGAIAGPGIDSQDISFDFGKYR